MVVEEVKVQLSGGNMTEELEKLITWEEECYSGRGEDGARLTGEGSQTMVVSK